MSKPEIINLLFVIPIIILILLGRKQLPDITHRVVESIRHFQMHFQMRFQSQRPELWREQLRMSSEDYGRIGLLPIVFILGLIVLAALVALVGQELLTGKQALGSAAVLSVWLIVGYFCFGRRN